jgi:hypothetical protein
MPRPRGVEHGGSFEFFFRVMSSANTPHRNFLVTSVGAYDDSGVGTGGFVSIHEGNATVIDQIDSTGLCAVSGVIYRFARGLQSIVGYRLDGVRYVLKVPEVRDIHDIALDNGEFICVSTGTNEVVWIDALGRVTRRWKGAGERDAWHLNCLCKVDGRWHVAAFGRFAGHRDWTKGCLGKGFVMDLEKETDVVQGLNGPHNPRLIDGTWVVCDSHTSALAVQRPGEPVVQVPLGGFTRGLDWDEQFYYVGISANRKAAVVNDYSEIAVVRRSDLQVIERIRVPFPEIYEIIRVDSEISNAFASNPARFQIAREDERMARLEEQVAISCREVGVLRSRLEPLRPFEHWRSRWDGLRRRLGLTS